MSGSDHIDQEIAIIGMAGRFPGARNVEELWRNLREGVESISFFAAEELEAAGVSEEVRNHPGFVNAGAVLEGVEGFDAPFFGLNPREAETMDPQHRVFLECCWSALEDAGYDPDRFRGPVGVYGGCSINTYLLNHLSRHRALVEQVGSFQIGLGNDKDFLPTRVSYKLNLRGPSLSVQTACSTSLVAVHLACQSLLSHECDMALAGGVSILFPQKTGYVHQEGSVLSPDGHCRAFDAAAKGVVTGQGAAVVVLKRLVNALEDGDTIHAVIRGSAVNNDGSAKAGYTAPSVDGQADVIAEALGVAGVSPETIQYVEAHGTGTELGDSIEVAALTQVLSAKTSRKGFCALGSVKTNVGHLDAAAGVTGLIKTVLSLEHGEIPPSLHFERPNPGLGLEDGPVYVNGSLAPWPPGPNPRRAGVSSFGIGGTNAHVVLEEAPAQDPSGPSRPWQLLLLSARTSTALETRTDDLTTHLRDHPELGFADVAYTSQVGRKPFEQRRFAVCRDSKEAAELLASRDTKRTAAGLAEGQDRPVVFLFPGLGDQYAGMGLGLFRHEPVFREQVDRCCEILKPHLGLDLREAIYPAGVEEPSGGGELDLRRLLRREPGPADEASRRLRATWLAQPALFVIEYAAAQLWMSWGVQPKALIGYSLGEYTAACIAGVLALEDALALVAERAKILESIPAGAMLAVPLSEEEVVPLLGEDLSLSAVNGPDLCVVAGPEEGVARLEARLTGEGNACRRLETSHAFHSRMMEPAVAPLVERIRKLKLSPPSIPYISNVTGTWITAEQATDPAYWGRHLRETVRFGDGVRELWCKPERLLLEVGPGRSLSSLALQHPEGGKGRLALPSIRQANETQPDLAFTLEALGRVWLAGAAVDWEAFSGHERRRRVPLPTYPFEHQRYWVDPPAEADARPTPSTAVSGKREDISDWFYLPAWRATASPLPFGKREEDKTRWIVLGLGDGLEREVVRQLLEAGRDVSVVRPGAGFGATPDGCFTVRPEDPEDYRRMVEQLRPEGNVRLVHLWSITGETEESGAGFFEAAQRVGYYSLLYLAQAFLSEAGSAELRVGVISDRLFAVSGDERILPEKATLLGPCKVLPQESSQISCQAIDVHLGAGGPRDLERVAAQVLAEIEAGMPDISVAYRGSRRWVEQFEPLRLTDDAPARRSLRPGGVYLVLGGLGNIGLQIASFLAREAEARLALVGRSPLPPPEKWEGLLASRPAEDPVRRRIERLQALERAGAQVLVLDADLTDEVALRETLDRVEAHFGALHGVFHAAGVTGGPSIQAAVHLGPAESEIQFSAKAHGLYVLERVLEGREIDFCCLVASASSVLGGLGSTAYSAANLFLDAFVASRNAPRQPLWLSAAWDPWPDSSADGETTAHSSIDQYKMTVEESHEAFRRALTLAPEQVVVATGDLEARIGLWLRRSSKADPSRSSRHVRKALASSHVAPRNETERLIADVWEDLLGMEPIGVHDNFFALGGHSLLGTQVLARLSESFQVNLSFSLIFQAPTVAELALAVEVALIESLEEEAKPA